MPSDIGQQASDLARQINAAQNRIATLEAQAKAANDALTKAYIDLDALRTNFSKIVEPFISVQYLTRRK